MIFQDRSPKVNWPLFSAFCEEIGNPDGFFLEEKDEDDELKVRYVTNDMEHFVFIGRSREHESYIPILSDALIYFSEQLEDKKSLEQEIRLLKEQLALARKAQFGTSSEQQANQTQEDTPAAEDATSGKEKKPKLRVVRNAGRRPLPEHLPRDTVLHELLEADQCCPCCGKKMCKLGEEVTEQLTVIPAQYRVRKNVRSKYACRDCGKITTAPMPKSMVPGSSYGSPEFLTHIAVNKYQYGLPFYRQETIFEQAGLQFNRTTMANLMNTCADQLTPLLQLLKDELISQKITHADETTIQVLKEEGRKPQTKSYLWLYRSAASAAHQVVLFDYQETRSGEHPRKFLQGFNGYLQVDGYSGYNNIHNITRVACMAHIRRKFVKAFNTIPAGEGDHSYAQQAIDMIGELYGIEKRLVGQPVKAVFDMRQKESVPILMKFKKWLDDLKPPRVAPRGLLGIAIHYAIEQWPAMMRYVDDGDLAIDNNISEREIKQVVIGRKNWLFADTPDGAYTNATMYSLVQTAKANGLDPSVYLRHVFATLPNLKTADEVKQLLPWNMQIAEIGMPEIQLAA